MTGETVVKPKEPGGTGWLCVGDCRASLGSPFVSIGWAHRFGLMVISAVERAEVEPGHEDLGPVFHISISRQRDGRTHRCNSVDARWVLRAFGMEEGEEDNHVPYGKVRNFWRPVADRLVGLECPCKAEEPAIREDKGDYVWRP